MTEPTNHDQIRDLLEDYIDERLDRPTRRAVEKHLDTCDECRAILDGVAAVDLGQLGAPVWDERAMRSAVRRSMLRTAVSVVVLLVAGVLALFLLSALVLQPLLVDRGGRANAATRLTADLAIMFNPGAAVEEWRFDSGGLSRTSSVRLVTPVGTTLTELGSVDSRLTLTGFGDADGGAFDPMVVRETGGDGALVERLAELGDGTVTRIELGWNEPIAIGEADALTKAPQDVRVVWLGFAVDGAPEYSGPGFDAGGVLGAATCDEVPIPSDLAGAGSGGGAGSVFSLEPSAIRAWGHLDSALEELLAHPEILEGVTNAWSADDVERARRFLAERRVRTMVVTGPTSEVLAFVDGAAPDFGAIRDIDFFNWFSPLCGR